MATYQLDINNSKFKVEVTEGTSLLWVLREHLGLTGTKYSCGIGQCGSCMVHIDNQPMRACLLQVDNFAEGQKIKTIEGLSKNGDHPVQKAWIEAQAPQCGYCQSGQIMQAVALLDANPNPTTEEIKTHMNGILCRCGTYLRIIKAIELAAASQSKIEN
ncbi:(2Fe-2S)-binding protein [Arenibacter sp. BSSL-BM3]|uniref:(2Fe-2S)-binding protein n=1 Tax=Arenibacter arenosicollis TaxID=2762274 RepID=A0ABR7QQU4_9FLAO|nr:(2Fe-2S)-binding protein [Arenibacter arenosicollis]MBC8769552.1 (2Fe-2S)-binding protein [Arenibacter arenosicollis]